MWPEASRGRPEFWPRQLVKKWLNLRNTGNIKFDRDTDMDVEHTVEEESDFEELDYFDTHTPDFHKNVDLNDVSVAPLSNPLSLLRGQSETLRQQFVDYNEYRVAVHTWNVAGKPPPDHLDLEEWIDNSQPADIYVFGFQEIVPLNANNVVLVEDQEPAARWESKIREYLNKKVGVRKEDDPFQSRSAPLSPRNDDMGISVTDVSDVEKMLGRCVSGKNLETAFLATEGNLLNYEKNIPAETLERLGEKETLTDSSWKFERESLDFTTQDLHEAAMVDERENIVLPLMSSTGSYAGYNPAGNQYQYSRVASKQMVGIFITVWIRSQLWRHVHNVKVSAVGLGLMHYLGNKGSISVSMCLHHTSFCFVCSHLTSGHKQGDQFRRNADFMEILRRTKFPRLVKVFNVELPETILAHDRIVWLGDLNYRLALSDKETWQLVSCRDWESLLRKDQLKLEQGEGRVFKDWMEGPIHFPPTYKYKEGTDQFSGETSSTGEKRRSPAWCDRILWYGKGMRQVAYTRGDLKLSDHRSVCATFIAEVEVVSHRKLKKACIYPKNIKLIDLETEKGKINAPSSNALQRKRSHKFRNLGRASSFVYPESSVSSARSWKGDLSRREERFGGFPVPVSGYS
ncbi:type I inositol polyphosphate 5-phosphatase 10 isoform X1 [Physcomitrium patens]|uniref:Inositol polyphosphate-related phosphatase domain-containing protein n=2 Tax=Physcomitrium patens TaxID=3218 RepID=A0A2K1IAI8_PHYPA|nr:hypothetical protein PHYPA_030863 [Physcomitrium patens]